MSAPIYSEISSNRNRTAFLMLLFIVFVVGLGWFFGRLSGYGYEGLAIAIAISLFMSALSYWGGDKVALFTAGAKPIEKNDAPEVYRLVENLAITAGLATPKIYLIPDPGINAFATGRDPRHASIAITTGAVNVLDKQELEGVIAHELSHVKNYDIRLMMVVLVLVGLISLMANWMFRFRFFAPLSSGQGGRRDDSREGGGQLAAVMMIVGLVLMILSPIIAQIIQLAVSRRREYLADASGALLTRYPEGLARALEKISAQNRPLAHANDATAHLYLANPFGVKKSSIHNLFSTHPPIEKRIEMLRKMSI